MSGGRSSLRPSGGPATGYRSASLPVHAWCIAAEIRVLQCFREERAEVALRIVLAADAQRECADRLEVPVLEHDPVPDECPGAEAARRLALRGRIDDVQAQPRLRELDLRQ